MKINFSEEQGDLMPSKSLQDILRGAMSIMLTELSIQDQDYDLDVSFHTSLDKMKVTGQEGGKIRACVDPTISRDRRISVMVQRDRPHIIILSLAHELIHVRQMVQGRLKIRGEGERADVIFDGKRYSSTIIRLAQGIGLPSMLPWEEEAHQGMEALFLLVLHKLPIQTQLEIVRGMHTGA